MHLAISMYGCEVNSWVCLIFGQGVVWYTESQTGCESVRHKKEKVKYCPTE